MLYYTPSLLKYNKYNAQRSNHIKSYGRHIPLYWKMIEEWYILLVVVVVYREKCKNAILIYLIIDIVNNK